MIFEGILVEENFQLEEEKEILVYFIDELGEPVGKAKIFQNCQGVRANININPLFDIYKDKSTFKLNKSKDKIIFNIS